MKRILLHSVEQLLHFVMLLVMALSVVSVYAQDEVNTDINSVILAEGSLPITFENDPDNPWLIGDGYLYKPYSRESTICSMSTDFTIDKYSLLSYQIYSYRGCSVEVIINGKSYQYTENSKYYFSSGIMLNPGTYNVIFKTTYLKNRDETIDCEAQVSNVCLQQNWTEVTLGQAGWLGMSLLNALGDDYTPKVEMLKINGSMNDDDWATIKSLHNLKALDMSNTDITTIDTHAFHGNKLRGILLPETLIEINSEAFTSTQLGELTIPSSVEKIGHDAFSTVPLSYIYFSENSNLKQIDGAAFVKTQLMEFIMPDSVTELGEYSYDDSGIFQSCRLLQNIHISENITSIPRNFLYGCANLESIILPPNLLSIGAYAFSETNISTIEFPATLTSIGDHAFSGSSLTSITIPKGVTTLGANMFRDCSQLKEATLNSNFTNMYSTFGYCTSIETVTLPCPTPPIIDSDPFEGVTKSQVKLIVPDFAYQAYRGHSQYWYQFTGAVADDEASLSDYWAIRSELTLDADHVMRGTPSVEVMEGGTLNMDTDVTQDFNVFTYNTSESNPASFISNSNNVTANSLSTNFYVPEANKWFFFSPVADVNMSDVSYPTTDSWVIRYYDGAQRAANNSDSGNWVNVSKTDGVLKRGQGYIIQATEAGWLNMPAAADKQSEFFGANAVSFTLEENACADNEANASWNFVANPYPSYYDIYYIDMQAPITVWESPTNSWSSGTYRAYSLNDEDRADDSFVLRPMQPFFVQKSASDLTTGMPLTGRQGNATIDRTRAPKRQLSEMNPLRSKLNLELIREGTEKASDYTRIVINEEASLAYERTRDASKFMSMDVNAAQLFSLGEDNLPMAINERPYDNGLVGLGVYLPVSGETCTISATRADRQAWLYDSETGIEHDLTAADYVFTASKEGYDYGRFSIRFSPNVSAVDAIEGMQVKVAAANGIITVTAPEDAAVAIYRADGTTVATATGSTQVNAHAGVYVVKVNDRTFKTLVK